MADHPKYPMTATKLWTAFLDSANVAVHPEVFSYAETHKAPDSATFKDKINSELNAGRWADGPDSDTLRCVAWCGRLAARNARDDESTMIHAQHFKEAAQRVTEIVTSLRAAGTLSGIFC